jgi:hypothetical protein
MLLLPPSRRQAVSTSETSVNFYETTRHNIPGNCHLYTGLSEDVKCHSAVYQIMYKQILA